MTSLTSLLLQAAISLLLLVQGNPNVDPALREQAIAVANQAIKVATQQTGVSSTDTSSQLTASCFVATFNFRTPGATWSAQVSGGRSPYQYSWTMYNDISNYGEGSTQSSALMVNYSSAGTKNAEVRVTDASGTTVSARCSGSIANQSQYTPNITSTSAKAAGNFEMDAGGSASIYGSNLGGNDLGIARIFIGGVEATRLSVSYNTLSIMVPSSLQAGQTYDMYVSNVYGTSNVVRVKILSNLNNTVTPLTATCSAATFNAIAPGATWSAQVSGGRSPYQYSWTMYNDISNYGEGSTQSSALMVNYSSAGTKNAEIRITDASGSTVMVRCSGTIASSSASVVVPLSVTLSATPANVAPNGTITVNWSVSGGTPKTTDWIGMFASGTNNQTYQAYKYATGASSGSLTFVAPAVAGSYEFRYLPDNNYTSIATSNTVSVISAMSSGSLSASPNPCLIPSGSNVCTSYITWTSSASATRVYVTVDGVEQLFANQTSCSGTSCPAPWIQVTPHQATFTLYDYSSGSRGSVLGIVVVKPLEKG